VLCPLFSLDHSGDSRESEAKGAGEAVNAGGVAPSASTGRRSTDLESGEAGRGETGCGEADPPVCTVVRLAYNNFCPTSGDFDWEIIKDYCSACKKHLPDRRWRTSRLSRSAEIEILIQQSSLTRTSFKVGEFLIGRHSH
jgi:hypothetical protein